MPVLKQAGLRAQRFLDRWYALWQRLPLAAASTVLGPPCRTAVAGGLHHAGSVISTAAAPPHSSAEECAAQRHHRAAAECCYQGPGESLLGTSLRPSCGQRVAPWETRQPLAAWLRPCAPGPALRPSHVTPPWMPPRQAAISCVRGFSASAANDHRTPDSPAEEVDCVVIGAGKPPNCTPQARKRSKRWRHLLACELGR